MNLDITCTVDGKEYAPGSKKDINLNVGAGNYFSEFEEKLIGKQLGDIMVIKMDCALDQIVVFLSDTWTMY